MRALEALEARQAACWRPRMLRDLRDLMGPMRPAVAPIERLESSIPGGLDAAAARAGDWRPYSSTLDAWRGRRINHFFLKHRGFIYKFIDCHISH